MEIILCLLQYMITLNINIALPTIILSYGSDGGGVLGHVTCMVLLYCYLLTVTTFRSTVRRPSNLISLELPLIHHKIHQL